MAPGHATVRIDGTTSKSGGVLNWITKLLSRIWAPQPKTRLVFVFIGSLITLGSVYLPWYEIVYWLTPAGIEKAMTTGHYEAIGVLHDPLTKSFGSDNVVQSGYSGTDLANSTGPLHALAVPSPTILYLGLLVLAALLVLWVSTSAHQNLFLYLVRILLRLVLTLAIVRQIFDVAFNVFTGHPLTVVTQAATTMMRKDLGPLGATGIVHVSAGFSWGTIALLIGTIALLLGVIGGRTDAEQAQDDELTSQVNTIAKIVRVIGIGGRLAAALAKTASILSLVYAVLNVN
jgi:hypothetical protein